MAKVCFLYQGRRFDHSDPRWDEYIEKGSKFEILEGKINEELLKIKKHEIKRVK